MAVITEVDLQVRATELQAMASGTSRLEHIFGIDGVGAGRSLETLPNGTASGITVEVLIWGASA